VTAISLWVNGSLRQVEVPEDMPLLWVLRDVLGLTGTKFGCGVGVCGACTVHVEGEATRACQVRAADLGPRKIVTIEGLAPDGRHPLQRAWLEADVAQCGYCQPGQIMQAAWLLSKHPRPTGRQIDEGMANNLCRCGTYQRIREAIQRRPARARRGGKPARARRGGRPARRGARGCARMPQGVGVAARFRDNPPSAPGA
jgi:isoquinoline 1-oxidoreductase alpha subunit